MGGVFGTYGVKRNSYIILVVKPKGKRKFGRPGCRWDDNIAMEITEIGWMGMDWINLSQERVQWWACVNMVMNLWSR
jgi:hypothetical protein